jgi:hypothetical protein
MVWNYSTLPLKDKQEVQIGIRSSPVNRFEGPNHRPRPLVQLVFFQLFHPFLSFSFCKDLLCFFTSCWSSLLSPSFTKINFIDIWSSILNCLRLHILTFSFFNIIIRLLSIFIVLWLMSPMRHTKTKTTHPRQHAKLLNVQDTVFQTQENWRRTKEMQWIP